MFKTIIRCPNCRSKISLEDARTTVPVPEESTAYKTVELQYTVCPICRRDFRVVGERAVAIALAVTIFALLALNFLVHGWYVLGVVAAVLAFQKKIFQVFIRAEHA